MVCLATASNLAIQRDPALMMDNGYTVSLNSCSTPSTKPIRIFDDDGQSVFERSNRRSTPQPRHSSADLFQIWSLLWWSF